MDPVSEVSEILRSLRASDRTALDRLFELLYDDLRRISRGQFNRRGQTVDSGALVHELYLKFAGRNGFELNDRRHFFAVAAQAMRGIAVDHARRKTTAKRGGEVRCVTISQNLPGVDEDPVEVLALSTALDRLERTSPRLAQVAQLRFFAGLSVEETADVLDVNLRTVQRDWQKARAFLARELEG